MCNYRYILLFRMCKIINYNKKADKHCSIGLYYFSSAKFMVPEAYLDFESADLP